jgi:class 3 adenylate cyclase
MVIKATSAGRKAKQKKGQRSYYIAAEYIDQGDRLLVEDGDVIGLYSVNLRLAQYWYASVWWGERFDLEPFREQRLDWGMEPEQAESIKNSGLVLAQCLRHGEGMPIVEELNGHPVYGSALEILIGEVFDGSLSHLIERETGIAGLTISPMHTRYAIFGGRAVGQTSIESVAMSVSKERPDLVPHAAPDGTVTILFSDIENSTALNERLGDKRWMDLLREQNEIVRREKALHRGFEVKTIGDAFMLAFQSAGDALRCAINIQRALARRNEGAKQEIKVRIGLHAGELVKESDDFYGLHVNLASRVASQAGAGDILVSALLHDLVKPMGEFVFKVQKSVGLKGLKGRHRLYSVVWRRAGGSSE